MISDKKFNLRAHVNVNRSPWDTSYNMDITFSLIKNDEWTGSVVNLKCGETFYKDLAIVGWLGDQYDKVLGADEVLYSNVHSAKLYDLERMCKSLKKISKKLETIAEKYGSCKSFDQFFLRVCGIIGVTEVVLNNEAWNILGNEYVDRKAPLKIDDACMWLRTLENKLCTKGREKAA